MFTVLGWIVIFMVLAGNTAAQVIANYQRAPWCWCGHYEDFHRHYTGTWCSTCHCNKFRAPFIKRQWPS